MDKNAITARIKELLTKMYNSDQGKLADYTVIFKKNVPLTKRSNFAAYLIMEEMEEKATQNVSTAYRYQRPRPAMHTELPNFSEEESVQLFFNVGKRNRVYIRELLSLLLSKTSIKREDIGHIKLLPNYSFVQLRKEQAESVIAALNGIDYRGRILTVSYARSRNSIGAPSNLEAPSAPAFVSTAEPEAAPEAEPEPVAEPPAEEEVSQSDALDEQMEAGEAEGGDKI
jgi:hypothetical protein